MSSPPDSFGELSWPPTRAEAVASELRRLIQSGQLKPGTRLYQVEIAKRIGVSTTPVREAFMRLAREGLIRQDAHRGVMVFLPSLEELEENYEIRISLESLATREAAKKLTPEDLFALDGIIREMGETEDPSRYVELNRSFHSRIYDAAAMPHLSELIENLRNAAAAYVGLLLSENDPEYAAEVQGEHEQIAAALAERKGSAAAKLVCAHLRNSAKHIARRIAESRDEELKPQLPTQAGTAS